MPVLRRLTLDDLLTFKSGTLSRERDGLVNCSAR